MCACSLARVVFEAEEVLFNLIYLFFDFFSVVVVFVVAVGIFLALRL